MYWWSRTHEESLWEEEGQKSQEGARAEETIDWERGRQV
jgi:hypothetical protein